MRHWILLGCLLAGPSAWAQPGLTPQTAGLWLDLPGVLAQFPEGTTLSSASPTRVIMEKALPFGDVGLARPLLPAPVAPPVVSDPKTWTLPPFPTIGPPSEGVDSSPAQTAPAFSSISPGVEEVSSALRPLPGGANIRWSIDDYKIPIPVSSVCYLSTTQGLVQLSLYRGSNSFFAEQAFFALQAALDRREKLDGVGDQGCLGIYRDPEVATSKSDGGSFQAIAPVGQARPDLLDPGLQKARQAPSFKDISTSTSAPEPLDLSKLPRSSGSAQPPRARREYYVLLACFPNRGVTMELVVDTRLGNPQILVDMANGLQSRVRALRS